MTDALGRGARLLTYAFQVGIVAVLGYGIWTGQMRVVTNAALTLVVGAFPLYVRYRYDRPLNSFLALWIALAAFIHAFGITGPYRAFGWYDQFAHGVSGALVAGVGYALVRTLETEYDSITIPDDLRGLFVVVFTLAFGVVWEVAEFALGLFAGGTGEATLIQFGLEDVVWDLVFDLVGAIVVALWAHGLFADLRGMFGRHVGDEEQSDRAQ